MTIAVQIAAGQFEMQAGEPPRAPMEALRTGLSRRPSDLSSPDWHKEILDERRCLVAEGKLKFLDWVTAGVRCQT